MIELIFSVCALLVITVGSSRFCGGDDGRFKHDAASDPVCSTLRKELYVTPYDQVGAAVAFICVVIGFDKLIGLIGAMAAIGWLV